MQSRPRHTARRPSQGAWRERRRPAGRPYDQHYRGARRYGGGRRGDGAEDEGRRPWRRLLRQVLVAAALFLVTLGATHLPFGLGARARVAIHYALSAPYDLGLGRALAAGGALEGWRAWTARLGEQGLAGWWANPAAAPGTTPDATSPDVPAGAQPGAGGSASQGEMLWPADGAVTSAFGWVRDAAAGSYQLHEGLDIATTAGSPVRAALGGAVKSIRRGDDYGWLVELDHGADLTTVYAHNESVLVREGQGVAAGQQIAIMGATGNATGAHVHFEVRCAGAAVDPLPWLRPKDGAGAGQL